MRIARFIEAALALALCAACDQHDLGRACPQLEAVAATAGGTRLETAETVEQNAGFPCDELICVATDGRAGYCSRKCIEDVGCPAGFECRQVQKIGDFANDKFCVWKRCDRPRDCGSHDDFRCCHPGIADQCGGDAAGLQLATGEEIKLCTFRE